MLSACELEQLKAALRRAQGELRLALDAGRMCTCSWDAQTGDLLWAAGECLAELVPRQAGGSFRSLLDLVQPSDRPRVSGAIQAALAEHASFQLECRANAFDGSLRWLRVVGQFSDEPAGSPRVLGVIIDITSAKRAEQRQRFLTEASAALASSLDYETTLATVTRLALRDLADWCAVTIVEADGSLRRLAVAVADETLQQHADQLRERFAPVASAREGAARVLRTGQSVLYPQAGDAVLDNLSASEEHLATLRALGLESVMVAPLTARERKFGALTFVSNDPARRYESADLALAEELAQRCALAIDNARLYEEAQSAIRVRDEFLSVAAHELKTPLTSLRGFAQLSLRQLAEQGARTQDRLVRSLRIIDQQADRLGRLIAQLLEVSRIDTGQLRLECEDLDLANLIRRAVATVAARNGGAPIALGSLQQVQAWVDPLRIEQVLLNLLDNAIRHSPSTEAVEVSLAAAGGTAEISVLDHGPGIPPESRARMFERFHQAHAHSGTEGMGLGLYISRQIAEAHGGGIRAEFPAGGGTCLVLSLPLTRPLAAASA